MTKQNTFGDGCSRSIHKPQSKSCDGLEQAAGPSDDNSKEIDEQISMVLDALLDRDTSTESGRSGYFSESSSQTQENQVECSFPAASQHQSNADDCKELLLGHWTDSNGSAVLVCRSGASSELTASLARPGKTDLHLGLWQDTSDGKWHCGDGCLDESACTSDTVTWKFWNGRVSVWTRNYSALLNQNHSWRNNGLASNNAMMGPFMPDCGFFAMQPTVATGMNGGGMLCPMVMIPVMFPVAFASHEKRHKNRKR